MNVCYATCIIFREHEVSFNQHLINHNQEDPKEIDENHELHTKRQMDLNIQLTEIQKNIVIKEGLAKQLNNQYVVDYEVSLILSIYKYFKI